MAVTLLCGDSLTVLRTLPSASVHCVVTSPPYWGLRDYGVAGQIGLEDTPEQYTTRLVEVFQEIRRVLRSDGTVWLNLGDSYWGGKGKSGYELPHEAEARRANGETFQTAHNVPGYREMRPADGKHPIIKPKDIVGIPWMVAFALRADGWYLRSDIIWAKPNPMPESVTDRPTKSHEYLFLLAKSGRYYYDAEAVKETGSINSHGGGNPESHLIRKTTIANGGTSHSGLVVARPAGINGRNRRSVWFVPTRPYPGAHFATFPPALVEPCILAGTSERGVCQKCGAPWGRVVENGLTAHDGHTETLYPKGTTSNRLALLRQAARERGEEYTNSKRTVGWQPTCTCNAGEPVPATVLDPFVGSGTTCAVAAKLHRDSIGIDLNADYLELARQRIPQPSML